MTLVNQRDRTAVFGVFDITLALKRDGTLRAWGWNSSGQLGLGDTADRHAPTQVGSESDWAAVSGGEEHTLTLKQHGTLWAWGLNERGELGLGAMDYLRPIPTEITASGA